MKSMNAMGYMKTMNAMGLMKSMTAVGYIESMNAINEKYECSGLYEKCVKTSFFINRTHRQLGSFFEECPSMFAL